jgi:hypothetical protein
MQYSVLQFPFPLIAAFGGHAGSRKAASGSAVPSITVGRHATRGWTDAVLDGRQWPVRVARAEAPVASASGNAPEEPGAFGATTDAAAPITGTRGIPIAPLKRVLDLKNWQFFHIFITEMHFMRR